MQNKVVWGNTEPTGAALTKSTSFTAAGSGWRPHSEDMKHSLNLQKGSKTLSTGVLRGLILRVIIALTPK